MFTHVALTSFSLVVKILFACLCYKITSSLRVPVNEHTIVCPTELIN